MTKLIRNWQELAQAEEIERLRLALDQIARPLHHLRLEAERTGCVLSGGANIIANDTYRLQEIAKQALEQSE